jgi:serine/threonine-protein kinase
MKKLLRSAFCLLPSAFLLTSCVYWTPRSHKPSTAATIVENVPMQKWDIKSCGAGALSAVLQHHGDPTTMDQWQETLRKRGGGGMSIATLGYVQARVGRPDEARRVLQGLADTANDRYVPALAFATVHLGLGEDDQALDWLEKAYAERFNRLAYLRREAIWQPLGNNPRFQDLLRRINLPE